MMGAFQRSRRSEVGRTRSTESVKLPWNFDVDPTSNKTHIHTAWGAYRHVRYTDAIRQKSDMIEGKSDELSRRERNV